MEKNNDLISVIEDLLEADMTDPKKVKNPQNKVGVKCVKISKSVWH